MRTHDMRSGLLVVMIVGLVGLARLIVLSLEGRNEASEFQQEESFSGEGLIYTSRGQLVWATGVTLANSTWMPGRIVVEAHYGEP